MEVKIKLLNDGIMPTKGTEKAAGYDLYVPGDTLIPHGRFIVALGFILQLPAGFKAEIDPRSGYSAKGFEGVSLDGVEGRFNCDVIHGLIDEDYRGVVGVIVKNEGEPFWVKKQQRIAQMTISKVDDVTLTRVLEVDETTRNTGGFGSTGK